MVASLLARPVKQALLKADSSELRLFKCIHDKNMAFRSLKTFLKTHKYYINFSFKNKNLKYSLVLMKF